MEKRKIKYKKRITTKSFSIIMAICIGGQQELKAKDFMVMHPKQSN